MLQLRTAGLKALDQLRLREDYPPRWTTMKELEQVTDTFLEHFLAERLEVSRELGPGFLAPELLDRSLRTSEKENMDMEWMSEPEKLKLVQALHRMNSMMMIYGRYIEILEPLFNEIAGATGKQVRLLELASGSGGLAFAIAEYAQKNHLNISVKASDIIPEFVSAGNRHAEERRLPVTFRLINAFDMHHLGPDEFDIVVISQSMHHFTPGQLALMIAQAKQHTTTAFVGIDGHRSMLLLGGVPLVASLQGMIPFAQDGLTSARKFYSDLELDIITRIATGENNHRVTCSWPMSILTIRFDGKNP